MSSIPSMSILQAFFNDEDTFFNLPYDEKNRYLAMLTPDNVVALNTFFPGEPYLQYLVYLAKTNQWITPTVEHNRDFEDAFRENRISFPRNL